MDSGAEPEQTGSTGQSWGKGSPGRKGHLSLDSVNGTLRRKHLPKRLSPPQGGAEHPENCLETCSQKTVSATEEEAGIFLFTAREGNSMYKAHLAEVN